MSKTKAGYFKKQFMQSTAFTAVEKDVLQALMHDGETYTMHQARKMVKDFAKRKVN